MASLQGCKVPKVLKEIHYTGPGARGETRTLQGDRRIRALQTGRLLSRSGGDQRVRKAWRVFQAHLSQVNSEAAWVMYMARRSRLSGSISRVR